MRRLYLPGASLHLHYLFINLYVTLPYYFYLPQDPMTFKKDLSFTPHTTIAPVPTAGGTTFLKQYHHSDVRITVSDLYILYPTTTHPHTSTVTSNTTTPVPINTLI